MATDVFFHFLNEEAVMIRKCLASYLVVAMFVIAIVTPAKAAFSPSEAVLTPSMRTGDVEKIQTVLEHKVIKQRLQDLGFNQTEIAARLAQMTDDQIHSFAQRLDELNVGGDALGAVIGVLLIIILVIVILHLTGHRVLVR